MITLIDITGSFHAIPLRGLDIISRIQWDFNGG